MDVGGVTDIGGLGQQKDVTSCRGLYNLFGDVSVPLKIVVSGCPRQDNQACNADTLNLVTVCSNERCTPYISSMVCLTHHQSHDGRLTVSAHTPKANRSADTYICHPAFEVSGSQQDLTRLTVAHAKLKDVLFPELWCVGTGGSGARALVHHISKTSKRVVACMCCLWQRCCSRAGGVPVGRLHRRRGATPPSTARSACVRHRRPLPHLCSFELLPNQHAHDNAKSTARSWPCPCPFRALSDPLLSWLERWTDRDER